MNYAKVISSALTLFPKKIKVTLIDAATGKSLGQHKMMSELLPAAFNRPTVLTIDNTTWRVIKADPLLADDFLFTKKLSLHVRDAASADGGLLHYALPSVCSEKPGVSPDSLYHDLTLDMPAEEWRQLEFLPLASQALITADLKPVEEIVHNQPNPLLGYQQQHIRAATGAVPLEIPWGSFFSLLRNPVTGRIALGREGFVAGGFAVQSDSFTYYGVVENSIIRYLGLLSFDAVDDELMQVLDTFKLVLVDWNNASTLSAEPGEKPKSEYVSI